MLLKLCYEHMSGDRGANVLFVSVAAYNRSVLSERTV